MVLTNKTKKKAKDNLGIVIYIVDVARHGIDNLSTDKIEAD